MSYRLINTSAAKRDLAEATEYYTAINPSLAHRFLDAVDTAFIDLEQHPTYYSYFGNSNFLRSHTIKSFPYTIVFEIKDDDVFVIGIYGRKQNRNTISRF